GGGGGRADAARRALRGGDRVLRPAGQSACPSNRHRQGRGLAQEGGPAFQYRASVAGSRRGPGELTPTRRGRGMEGLIAVGRILRPQGRGGEVRLEALTDAPERFRELAECYLVPPPGGERRSVEGVRFQGTTPVLKLTGSETIDDALALVGRLVSVPRERV